MLQDSDGRRGRGLRDGRSFEEVKIQVRGYEICTQIIYLLTTVHDWSLVVSAHSPGIRWVFGECVPEGYCRSWRSTVSSFGV